MLRIGLVQQKGGAAKTTLTIHLAVAAQMDGLRTAIVDTDPQASAAGVWARARGGKPPMVAATVAAELSDVMDAAAGEGIQVVFVDTPPHTAPAMEMVAKNVDFVIVPVQPSILDVAATAGTVKLLRAAGVRMAGVITRAAPRIDEEGTETRKALSALGLTLLETRIVERKSYRRALTQGEAVCEFEPQSKAAKEMRKLWREVRKAAQQ